MNRKSTEMFAASITIGLEKGYSKETILKNKVIESIQAYQDKLINEKKIYLSASVTECEIVMSGQVEPHLKIGFINYPKFSLSPGTLKNEIENLAKELMEQFEQNRLVIEYHDETVMLEEKEEIDPRIQHERP